MGIYVNFGCGEYIRKLGKILIMFVRERELEKVMSERFECRINIVIRKVIAWGFRGGGGDSPKKSWQCTQRAVWSCTGLRVLI